MVCSVGGALTDSNNRRDTRFNGAMFWHRVLKEMKNGWIEWVETGVKVITSGGRESILIKSLACFWFQYGPKIPFVILREVSMN